MVVFAHNIGDLAVAAISAQPLRGRVHIASHVNAHSISLTLAVNRTSGVVLLEIPDHIPEHSAGCIGVTGVGHFVSDRPGHDGGVVLQPLIGGLSSVHGQLVKSGLVVVVVHQSVRLHIGLAHDVHSVLIAQPVQVGIIAVVGGTDRIDVVLLHKEDVLTHGLLGNSLSVEGVGVVAVDALQQQPLAVDSHGLPAGSCHLVAAVHLSGSKPDLTEAQLRGKDLLLVPEAVPES